MPVEFALLGGDRYKIIIGMDILKEHKMVVDLAQETLRFKLHSEDKVNLKLVPRGTIFKTKQLRSYREYVQNVRSKTANANVLDCSDEENHDLSNFEVSTLQVDDDTAAYVGEELADVAALA